MGQQQLLLLVLGIVIVGLAVVVGIQAFGENQRKANQDAMINDGIRIASDAQAWALKPTAFGGGEGKFTGLTLAKLGYEVNGSSQYVNANGTYSLADIAAGDFLINATSNSSGQLVDISVCDVDSDDIRPVVNNTTTAATAADCS